MKAVLLVGGEGTRLRPLTLDVPKPLVPVLNLPYLEQLLYFLQGFGVEEVILTACYLSELIEDFCRRSNELGIRLTYVVERFPLGTGGAVGNVAEFLDSTFLVFNADILTDFNLTSLLEFHRKKGGAATLALVPVSDPSRFGVADLKSDGRIVRFVEKPPREEAPSCFINAGIYVLEPCVLKQIPKGEKFSIEKRLFPVLARSEELYGLVQDAYWLDMGTPEHYLQAHRDFLDKKIALKIRGISPITGKESPEVSPVTIHPPVSIGEGCLIESSAVIGPYVVMGKNCRVGAFSRIKESILWDDVRVGENADIDQSVLGSSVRVENQSIISRKIISASEEKSY